MKRPVDWASRINRRWIVHHGLGQRADEWIAHLAAGDEKRLKKSCLTARAMIRRWEGRCGDPKPWFYSGLFSTATEDEAVRFLTGHRLTTATVPAMADHPEVRQWVESLCSDTRSLLDCLRTNLTDVIEAGKQPRRMKP